MNEHEMDDLSLTPDKIPGILTLKRHGADMALY